MVEFGELVTVDPWQAWPHEEHYFTPWLVQQENLDKLSAETGLPPLELEGREMREGGLRADVVAHSPYNFLRRTDMANRELSALGQKHHDFWRFYTLEYPTDLTLDPGYAGSNIYENIGELTVIPWLFKNGVGVYVRDKGSNIRTEQSELVNRFWAVLRERYPGVPDELVVGKNALDDREKWPEMAAWLHDRLRGVRYVVHQVLREANET